MPSLPSTVLNRPHRARVQLVREEMAQGQGQGRAEGVGRGVVDLNEFCRKSAYDYAATTKNCDGSALPLPLLMGM